MRWIRVLSLVTWECIRNRTPENGVCTKDVICDDMRLNGFEVEKKFSRWLGKLVDTRIVFVEGDRVKLGIEI